MTLAIERRRHLVGRRNGSDLVIWMLRLDDTRIVPTDLRSQPFYDVRNRAELEGRVLDLLARARNSLG